ncbi:hypothetical protein EXIGLDRAFT_760009 [Exidia glandulosa HHB12029]|uniref:Uncharacterized protein n=1 Tax=Exidia glandulosa HHB12029 TaxID=1314781 RepID=A0A165PGT3_EXIGL|nr:hypothetical protein EXIGLDRAFT_760009 [Exidia glandulosa HHB12029]
MANAQAPFNVAPERATAIGADMLVAVCGDHQRAKVVVALAFFGTAIFIAYAYHHGHVPPTAYMVLGALAAVWTHLAARPAPTPTAAAA